MRLGSRILIGEGNGNLLQCSCLENPRDGRAWWAAVYGVAQSRTRLKRLSSSSSSSSHALRALLLQGLLALRNLTKSHSRFLSLWLGVQVTFFSLLHKTRDASSALQLLIQSY